MTVFWIQLAIVMMCIAIGGRYGGVGLGAAGGFGLSILVLGFGLKPGSPPVSVLLIITAVIACVSILQAAGGLDLRVRQAEKLLRRRPASITFMAPLVTACFTFFCGTGYVAFSIYPVIAEVAAEAKIRPERPLSISVIASGAAIPASPMSAATAGMLGLLSAYGVSPLKLLLVITPAALVGVLMGALSVCRRGKELEDDPEFQRRVAAGEYQSLHKTDETGAQWKPSPAAQHGVLLFALGVITIVSLGSMPSLLPGWNENGQLQRLPIPQLIQIVILATGFLIMLICRVPGNQLAAGSVFRSGLVGVVGVFGVAWMTDTFFTTYKPEFLQFFSSIVKDAPMLFGVVLFFFSSVVFGNAATVVALMPIGLELGIPPAMLVALYPAVCGDFFIPAGAGQIGCVSFDRTGTTRIGRYVLNHCYMRPGVVSVCSAVFVAYLLSKIVF